MHFVIGPDYFKAFQERNNVTLMSAVNVRKKRDEKVHVQDWIIARKSFLFKKAGGKVKDRRLLTVMESQTFYTNTEPQRPVSVVVSVIKHCLYQFMSQFICRTAKFGPAHQPF